MNDEQPTTPQQPAAELTLYQQMEMGAYATCIAEDKIAEILGVELIGISFDDYDGSFEIFPVRDVADAAPSAEQHAAILALGCTRYWINFPDSTQRYGMGARTEVKNHCRWDRFNNHTLAKRAADQQPAAASAGASDERAAFKAWVKKPFGEHADLMARLVLRRSDGVYASSSTDDQWEAWQARAALQSPPVATALRLMEAVATPHELSAIETRVSEPAPLDELQFLQATLRTFGMYGDRAAKGILRKRVLLLMGADVSSLQSPDFDSSVATAQQSEAPAGFALMPLELPNDRVTFHAQCQSDEQCQHRWKPADCQSCQEHAVITYREFVRDLRVISPAHPAAGEATERAAARVPTVATPAMIEAFAGQLEGSCGSFFDWERGGDEAYAAMLAAADAAIR